MIASALYSQQGLAADLATQCMLGVPSYDRPLVEGRHGDLPVTINADHAKGNYPDNAVFTGNVDINRGIVASAPTKFSCISSRPRAAQPVRTVDALGNVHYDDNRVILKGPKARSNLNTKDTNVWQGDYQMVGRRGRGTADLMKQRGENRYTILENGSFTSCLPGSDTQASSAAKLSTIAKSRLPRSGTPASSLALCRFSIAPTCSCRWAISVVQAS